MENTNHTNDHSGVAVLNSQTTNPMQWDKPNWGRKLGKKPEWDGVNRREQADRREYSVKTLWQSFSSPRRFNGRRSTDRRFPVLDRFESGLAFFAIGLVILSIMDSIFTLTLITHGGSEVNPFMNWLLQINLYVFVGVKMLLTAIPAVLLVAMGNIKVFGRFRARAILGAALGMYIALIFYELALLRLI